MQRKLWLVMLTAMAIMSVSIVGSMALFTDTAQSSANAIVAGKVCLTANRNDGDSAPGPMFYIDGETDGRTYDGEYPGSHRTGLWAPGDSHTRTLTVENGRGCLPAYVESVQAFIQAGDEALADKLYVQVYTPVSGTDLLVAEGPMRTFLDGPVFLRNPDGSRLLLNARANRHLHFKVLFDLDADNSYQDNALLVRFDVTAIQQKHVPSLKPES
jgi:predicted ribosomally synthesized peptide with SipW-like signal peptide